MKFNGSAVSGGISARVAGELEIGYDSWNGWMRSTDGSILGNDRYTLVLDGGKRADIVITSGSLLAGEPCRFIGNGPPPQ